MADPPMTTPPEQSGFERRWFDEADPTCQGCKAAHGYIGWLRDRLALAEQSVEAERKNTDDQRERARALAERLALAEQVVTTARKAHANTGHNLPDWAECLSPPGTCWWTQLDVALARLDETTPTHPDLEETRA